MRTRRVAHAGIKLSDVAAAAGVSTATVSRALRQAPNDGGPTAARVRQAAADLGYVRYGPAAALSSRRSTLVGIRLDDRAGPLEEALAARCERELAAGGQVAVVQRGGASTIRMLEAGVGVVLAIGRGGDSDRALAASRGVRWVDLGATELDFDRGAEALAGFLHDTGHRRVALASVALTTGGLERTWIDALRRGCEAVSLEVSPEGPEIGSDAEDAVRTFQRWLERRDASTALICSSDLSAAFALRVCAYAGVPVPERLSVVGFGDTDFARLTVPALTSVRLPLHSAAVSAAASCAGTLRAANPGAASRSDRARLIIRASTAAPARA